MTKMNGSPIYLREMEERDWSDVHEYASIEKVSVHQPWGPNSLEESQEFVRQTIADANAIPRTRFVFAIVATANDKMIGAGEMNIRDFANKTGELGYIVNPNYWGRGIATEVARLVIQFGFEKLNLHRIYATCAPQNIGSQKVLEKIGMGREGRLRENLLLKEGWRDSLIYSVLQHEWEKNCLNG